MVFGLNCSSISCANASYFCAIAIFSFSQQVHAWDWLREIFISGYLSFLLPPQTHLMSELAQLAFSLKKKIKVSFLSRSIILGGKFSSEKHFRIHLKINWRIDVLECHVKWKNEAWKMMEISNIFGYDGKYGECKFM